MQDLHTRDLISARKSLWGSLSTLYLLACQVRVPVGDLGLCCVCVVSFERWLSPLCWFSTHRILQKLTKSVRHWAIFLTSVPFYINCSMKCKRLPTTYDLMTTQTEVPNPVTNQCVCVLGGGGEGDWGDHEWKRIKNDLCVISMDNVLKTPWCVKTHQTHTSTTYKQLPKDPPPPPTLKPHTHWCRHLHCCHPQENQQIYTTA